MEVLYQRCAGLDVHKKTVVAAVRLVEGSKVVTEVRTFAATTAGLLALSDWLSQNECTHGRLHRHEFGAYCKRLTRRDFSIAALDGCAREKALARRNAVRAMAAAR